MRRQRDDAYSWMKFIPAEGERTRDNLPEAVGAMLDDWKGGDLGLMAYGHNRKGAVDWDVLKTWGPALVIGAARIQAVRLIHMRMLRDVFKQLGSSALKQELAALKESLEQRGLKLGIENGIVVVNAVSSWDDGGGGGE